MFGRFRGRRRTESLTTADATHVGAWASQGANHGELRTSAPTDPGRLLAWRPNVQDGPPLDGRQLDPLPGVPKPTYGGAAGALAPGFLQEPDQLVLSGAHNVVVNRPAVVLGPVTMSTVPATPRPRVAQRPTTDHQNMPDVCGADGPAPVTVSGGGLALRAARL